MVTKYLILVFISLFLNFSPKKKYFEILQVGTTVTSIAQSPGPFISGGSINRLITGLPDTQSLPVKILYMAYRPATWEEKALTEEVNEKRNLGGLVFVYYTNISDKPVGLRDWYLNRKESGFFRIAGDVAWDRRYTDIIAPGQTTVQEICGVSEDFQTGKPAEFAINGENWQPVGYFPGTFREEEVRVTSVVMDSSMTELIIHLRNFTDQEMKIGSIKIEGKSTSSLTIVSPELEPRGHIIATLKTKDPFTPGELVIIRVEMKTEDSSFIIYSHRNAYADYFPNGTWGIEESQYPDAASHHLNTMVRGGKSTDAFFKNAYKTTGIKAMPHTGLYPDIDMIRDLEHHPAVALWYIHDEPDWTRTPQLVMAAQEMTKKYSTKKPTLITLCRNVKFFEYAFIPDIPCHDHYCVTAPTTSKWSYIYGTRLEETGYYTADLKYASEPKPIWVWTQGVHLWEERPKMPLPTPDEMGAQLYFNLGRGAKGNLWFTFLQEAGDRFPQSKKALQVYSRLIIMLNKDLLASDPYHGRKTAPPEADIATLISPDNMIVFVTNKDYQISDSAYLWHDVHNLEVKIQVPGWFRPADAFEIDPFSGLKSVSWNPGPGEISINLPDLHMGKVICLSSSKKKRSDMASQYSIILKSEETNLINHGK